MNPVVDGIVEKRVDREVSAPGVFLNGSEFVVAENHVFRSGGALGGIHLLRSGSVVFGLLAEGADLQNLLAVIEMNQTETAADDHAALLPENLFHLFGRGGCGNIVILRLTVQQKIADGAAHDVGFIPSILKGGDNIRYVLFNLGLDGHCLKGLVMMVSTPSSEGSRSG